MPSLLCSRSRSTARARKREPAAKSPAFSAAMPTYIAATGSVISCSRRRATRRRTDGAVDSGLASAMTASSRGSSSGKPMPSAASTMYCRVRARDRVHQQRCAIGTSDRNAASASPPASSCSAIVTNVLAAPFSNQTSPLIICCSQARRAASSGPTSSDSASLRSRLTTSTRPRSYTSSLPAPAALPSGADRPSAWRRARVRPRRP